MPTLLAPFDIHQPASLAEAAQLLVEYAEDGRAYAGGTELLLAMKQTGLRCGHLVDLKTIPGLATVERADGTVRIGALTTHLQLERNPVLIEALPALAQLEHKVANVRVRATGTLGGNLCFGEPHSDPATLLLCLDARLHITGPAGERGMPLADFLVGSYEVALETGEILRSVSVPLLRPTQRAAYKKFQLHEYPLLGLALVVDRPEPDRITQARVAIGSVSPTPRRVAAAESLIVERRLDEASDALADAADLIDDHEASAEYKRHLIRVLLRRTFEEAVDGHG